MGWENWRATSRVRPYQEFQSRQDALMLLCQRLTLVLEALNMPSLHGEVRAIEQRLSSETLRILVVGERGRGKSTVINALLRENLLPAYPVPTTALRCEIKWGEQPSAILHYRPSRNGLRKQPREVPMAEFESLLMAESVQEDHTELEWLEVSLPLPALEGGIEIIDMVAPFSVSPYDDDGLLESIPPIIPSADVVLFVLGCDFPSTKEESLEIDRVRCAGHKKLFFLCNRFDLVEPACRTVVKRRFTRYLRQFTSFAEQFVFFTDAKGALAGYLAGDRERVERSDMLAMETRLFNFLATVPGKEKLQHYIDELRAVVDGAVRLLPLKLLLLSANEPHHPWGAINLAPTPPPQRLFLSTDEQKLRLRQLQASREIEQLEKSCQRISMLLSAVRHSLSAEINVAATHFFLDIASRVEEWTRIYTPELPEAPWDIFVGDPGRRLVKELTLFLSQEEQEEFRAWTTSELSAMLRDAPGRIASELEQQLQMFVSDVAELMPERFAADGDSERETQQDLFERLFAHHKRLLAASGEVAMLVAERGSFTWHPAVLMAIMLQKEAVRAILRGSESEHRESIRDIVGQEYRHELETSPGRRADAIAMLVDDELRALQEHLNSALRLEIENARDLIFAAMESGRSYESQSEPERSHKPEPGRPQGYAPTLHESLLMSLEGELLAIRDKLEGRDQSGPYTPPHARSSSGTSAS